jgi:hypothetical protein
MFLGKAQDGDDSLCESYVSWYEVILMKKQ